MTGDVWSAAANLGRVLRADVRIAERNALIAAATSSATFSFDDGWQGALNQMLSMFGHRWTSMPLQLTKHMAYIPLVQKLWEDPQGAEWFSIGERIADEQQGRVEFIRSRLPGYPIVRGLEVNKGALAGERDRTPGTYPWLKQYRAMGLAKLPVLSIPDAATGHALNVVLERLERSSQWQRFAAAHQSITADLRDEIRAAHGSMSQMLQRWSAEEQVRYVTRVQLRGLAQERAEREATGEAREYLAAFREVSELIDSVMVVVEWSTRGEAVQVLPAPESASVVDGRVNLRWREVFVHSEMGVPVAVKAAWLPTVNRVEGISFNFDKMREQITTMSVRPYPDSVEWLADTLG